ncbi:hypothetical protein [Microcoleus sp. CAWBG58]|uniref:hypothetical protein n=1 Tax=Microcoleus sp. CAWBG58 TaxID=2841651 RepID=UPI0025EDAC38|nr:hypothetical protein [Microcoleus sp. CAWBG58]
MVLTKIVTSLAGDRCLRVGKRQGAVSSLHLPPLHGWMYDCHILGRFRGQFHHPIRWILPVSHSQETVVPIGINLSR